MPPPAARGRPAVFCSPACRKAAHEARRRGDPDAFRVEVVTVEKPAAEHNLDVCVTNALESPRGMRRMVDHLTKMLTNGDLDDPRWDQLDRPLAALLDAVNRPRRHR